MPELVENYLTIDKAYGPEEIKEKGSRFIGSAYPVKDREAAEAIIAGLRKQYHDSTHVCFAYRLGAGEEDYFRYSDDGEPSGSAGAPIFKEIVSKEYFGVLAAVVRYYGGVKLGTGGLVRAYGGIAKKVLDVSRPVVIHVKQRASVSFPFDFTGEMMQWVNRLGLDIVKQDYTAEGSVMILDVPIARVGEASEDLTGRSGGKIGLKLL